MKEGRVSIIIPVYNAVKYLQQCIESILAQTYGNYEIILVDDGSTDGSDKVCDRFEQENIRIIHQKNRGVSAARNKGIKVAQGEYIMFVDADDTIEPDALELLIKTRKRHSDLDVVIAKLDVMPGGDKIVWDDDFFTFASLNELWSPCAKLFKKKSIKYFFDENVFIAEDLWFCYQNRKTLKTFVYLPKVLYKYRQNKESAMKKKDMKATDLSCLDVVLSIISDSETPEILKTFYMVYYIKMYYYIFSKDDTAGIGRTEKEYYEQIADGFYDEVKKRKAIDIKLFFQAKLTPIYNLISRLRR